MRKWSDQFDNFQFSIAQSYLSIRFGGTDDAHLHSVRGHSAPSLPGVGWIAVAVVLV